MKYSTFVAAQLVSSAAALRLVPREVSLVLASPETLRSESSRVGALSATRSIPTLA